MRTVIVSDLHLGNGGPYDSFAGEEALPAFIDRCASTPTRILINGDGVDFLMNEAPLELDVQQAVSQARAIVAYPPSAAVLESMGRALAAGCQVVFRLGNHDIELALPQVQRVLRDALKQPAEIAAKLQFQMGEEPSVLEVGGARLLVTHGEHNDQWNRIDDWKGLLGASKEFAFAPGSELVKKFLNPLTHEQGLKFANPLTALAVAPAAMKVLMQGATVSLLWHLFRKGDASAFDDEEDLGLAKRVEDASLTEEEQAALEEFLEDSAGSFAEDDDGGPFSRARIKLARAGLRLYAGLQRRMAGKEGDSFFALDPTPAEWKEARRLAAKYQAGAVIIGHTHAARWGQEDGLVFANTGTWIWLMQLPPSDASDEVWMDFLSELRANKRLDPGRQKVARTIARFTAVEIEEHPAGGARVSLVEWVPDEGLRSHGSANVPRTT